jgi:outer membrane immunogenic protein
MTKIATLAAISALIAAPAFAADMPIKALPSPTPAPLYSWTGFYVGGNAGAIWSEATTNVSNLAPVAGISYLFPVNYPTIAANNLTNTGFIGGIQTGYNWQINSLVLGAEADFSGTTASGTVNASAPYPSHPFSTFNWATTVREDYFATIRGRPVTPWVRC